MGGEWSALAFQHMLSGPSARGGKSFSGRGGRGLRVLSFSAAAAVAAAVLLQDFGAEGNLKGQKHVFSWVRPTLSWAAQRTWELCEPDISSRTVAPVKIEKSGKPSTS